jgi:hypothetical protein
MIESRHFVDWIPTVSKSLWIITLRTMYATEDSYVLPGQILAKAALPFVNLRKQRSSPSERSNYHLYDTPLKVWVKDVSPSSSDSQAARSSLSKSRSLGSSAAI